MRAWELTGVGPECLAIGDRPEPEPGPRDVVVRTRAVSLNHRDLLMINGRYLRTLPPCMVPCSDAAGDVIAVGSNVTRCRVGDRVTSTFVPGWIDGQYTLEAARSALGSGDTTGVLADAFVLPEHGIVPVPERLSFEEASTLPCAGLTAWHALFEEAPLGAAATVLTLGTGGVSVFAAQFAREAGARVIGTSRSNEKRATLARLGVAETINYEDVPAWGERARELAGGAGVDHVVEVGGTGTFEQSVRAVRFGGTISVIGMLSRLGTVNLTPIFMRNLRVQGVMVGSRAMFERMNRALSAGTVRPVIDSVFEFDRVPDAFARLASGAHFGKIVIRT